MLERHLGGTLLAIHLFSSALDGGLKPHSDIDLLVTDVGLPGLNGRQLADAARAAYPDLKVLLMTGYAGKAGRNGEMLERGIELIVKPFSLATLGERVQRMLQTAGAPGA